ncbi:hypothetical protein MIMGU_mgv1a011796mg [Erythranthe guttata]|uniref:Mitochondrial import inner membrane translocase subunit TIM50 n=1 Tax=Erythranthe guttata TaxID=4155 RepID=A0A022REH6_ERYGU|nr:PREDICTED: uncharacterized FCP1 homology domain-containing protein C1271.03c-like [Erythranthe guttata]EYU38606.1 hypothetical protein MIMGU_mgv1a011796mg [Erythranthe guttata]|eukprot:XP_012836087.1 PREDICTED: uncharacterized FCP1 homology domain-containing protein C1271.03c-like [Erythranthe guttata]
MAEKSKLKLVFSDDESSGDDDYDSGNDVDLGLSLDKLNLGPKKKLLVLCLGGLLVHRVHLKNQSTVRGLRPDVVYGKFWVFKRPFCTDFLKFCFERFEVALWSSAMEHNIEGILDNITGGMRNKFLFVWNQDECMESDYFCLHNNKKPLFLKKTKDLWEKKSLKGQYSASNTLLIDDEPHTCLLNPPNTAIFPQPYKKHDRGDTLLGPDGELRKYLNGVADAEDVQSYVKDHKIGQPAITPEHPDWNFYSKVVRRYGKKEETTAEGSSSK